VNIVIFKDNDSEMMGIEINQKSAFYGNYWDFNVTSLEKLLRDIQKANPDIKVTVCKATIEDDE
jgi:hypothetical protein